MTGRPLHDTTHLWLDAHLNMLLYIQLINLFRTLNCILQSSIAFLLRNTKNAAVKNTEYLIKTFFLVMKQYTVNSFVD